jgi:hypothetical protein
MAQITQFPRGLVSLTGLRDMGEAPRDLAGVIAPTIDITQFLLLNRESIFGSVSVSSIGAAVVAGSVFKVPAGELWYVHAFSVSTTVFAGDTGRVATAFIDQGQVILNGLPQQLAAAVAVNQSIGSFQSSPGWIGPGVELACLVEAFTGVSGFGIGFRASISRLRI